jgi:hypothetical protein
LAWRGGGAELASEADELDFLALLLELALFFMSSLSFLLRAFFKMLAYIPLVWFEWRLLRRGPGFIGSGSWTGIKT